MVPFIRVLHYTFMYTYTYIQLLAVDHPSLTRCLGVDHDQIISYWVFPNTTSNGGSFAVTGSDIVTDTVSIHTTNGPYARSD